MNKNVIVSFLIILFFGMLLATPWGDLGISKAEYDAVLAEEQRRGYGPAGPADLDKEKVVQEFKKEHKVLPIYGGVRLVGSPDDDVKWFTRELIPLIANATPQELVLLLETYHLKSRNFSNFIGLLRECGCYLTRKGKSTQAKNFRSLYEDEVLKATNRLLKNMRFGKRNTDDLNFVYTELASGELFDTFVVLNKIINRIKTLYPRVNVNLKVILIDMIYNNNFKISNIKNETVENGRHKIVFNKGYVKQYQAIRPDALSGIYNKGYLVENGGYLEQFVRWFSNIEGINLEIITYSSFNDYRKDLILNNQLNLAPNLFVAADLDGDSRAMFHNFLLAYFNKIHQMVDSLTWPYNQTVNLQSINLAKKGVQFIRGYDMNNDDVNRWAVLKVGDFLELADILPNNYRITAYEIRSDGYIKESNNIQYKNLDNFGEDINNL